MSAEQVTALQKQVGQYCVPVLPESGSEAEYFQYLLCLSLLT